MPNVLITGANSGFGLLTAKTFAAAGYTVHAGYRSEAKSADLLALGREEGRVRPVKLDVTDEALIGSAVAEAGREAPIDVLVNNAGFEVVGPVDSLSDESLRRQFGANVLGPVRMIRAVAPQMRERNSGTIVNISSVAGWLNVPYASAYSASKHALEALSEALWFEMAPFGIRVAIIEPGGFATNFGDNVATDPSFAEGSPHWENAQRFRGAVSKFIEGGASGNDPQEVADLVFEAVTTKTPRLRYVAGNDARTLIPFYKSQEFEAFRDLMLAQLGLSGWGT